MTGSKRFTLITIMRRYTYRDVCPELRTVLSTQALVYLTCLMSGHRPVPFKKGQCSDASGYCQ